MTQPAALSPAVAAGAVLVMFLWALCFPLISLGLSGSPPMTFAALRAALSGAALLLVAQLLGRPAIGSGTLWRSVVLVALTATSLGFFGMFYGGGLVSPGLATVIANTQPLIAAILAWKFLDDRLTPIQRLGLMAGFIGIVLIGAADFSGSGSRRLGTALISVSAIAIAISNVVLKRLAGRIDPLRAMGWQLLIGSAPLGLLAFVIEDPTSVTWTPLFILNLVTLSVVGTAAVFWLWFYLLGRANLNQLNVYTFLSPVFGLLMGWFFFDERLRALGITGIGLSLLGIFWVSRPGRSE